MRLETKAWVVKEIDSLETQCHVFKDMGEKLGKGIVDYVVTHGEAIVSNSKKDVVDDPARNLCETHWSIDVNPLVRCKECAIRYDSCPMVVRIGNNVDFFTEDNDFCSRARRRHEEGE